VFQNAGFLRVLAELKIELLPINPNYLGSYEGLIKDKQGTIRQSRVIARCIKVFY
jgi:hypothetical protein